MLKKYLQVVRITLTVFSFTSIGLFPAVNMAADKSGSFTGSWVADGSKEVLPFGEKRETALFKISGRVNLKEPVGMQKDYWSECIGLADTESGSTVRCVWHSLSGQQIYIVLQSKFLAEGSAVTGTIVGGTGLVAGIKGSLSFHWSTMSFQEENNVTEVSGYATDLTGSFELP